MKERKILLNEFSFTTLCKFGFLKHVSTIGTIDIHINKRDIIKLYKGEIVDKEYSDEVIKIATADINPELFKEIIRRSPVFSELYYEL